MIPVIDKTPGFSYNRSMQYKVVETSTVTDEEIEKIVNEWVGQGYTFSGIHFVTTESSRRPRMAFLFFTRQD